jgi:hypothetical protein
MSVMRAVALSVLALAFGVATVSGLAAQEEQMQLSPRWEYVSDRVMGGVSTGQLQVAEVEGRAGARMTGSVSLDNNGGFVQMAFDLAPGGGVFDASQWSGIEVDVYGNGEVYEMRLRTTALTRPWQSFRAPFRAGAAWETIRLPFDSFEAHRTSADFDAATLRRVGILAIGRVFEADVTVAAVRLYR